MFYIHSCSATVIPSIWHAGFTATKGVLFLLEWRTRQTRTDKNKRKKRRQKMTEQCNCSATSKGAPHWKLEWKNFLKQRQAPQTTLSRRISLPRVIPALFHEFVLHAKNNKQEQAGEPFSGSPLCCLCPDPPRHVSPRFCKKPAFSSFLLELIWLKAG